MTLFRLALQSLAFYRRANVGTLLGTILAAAILTGALLVGDSVRGSLREQALARIGATTLALNTPGRFFRQKLANDLEAELHAPVAPVVLLPGTATNSAGDIRVGKIQAVGVDASFWKLAPTAPREIPAESVVLNTTLAQALHAKVGEEVLLRVDKPSLLSRDAPLSTIEDATISLRLTVSAIVAPQDFGGFRLDANQVPVHSAFFSLDALQKAVGMEGRANTLLIGGTASPATATSALWKHWELTDSGLQLRETPQSIELRTSSVFLDPPVGEAALKAMPNSQGVLTYFVNELRVGERSVPYSTVTAIDNTLTNALLPDEIVINQWLADALKAKAGDKLAVKYWVVGTMRKLEERTATLTVKSVVALAGEAADPLLMPDIPGLSDKKNCREWEPGVPIDLNKIQDSDQAYWDRYRGTPKAFIALKTGQRLWDNRFGNLTAVRYPTTVATRPAVEQCLRQSLSPASLGLFFQPIRERALAASEASTPFGVLFLSFSLFLIAAALILTALLAGFAVERRREELGTLLALGFTPKTVRRLLLCEGGLLALVGAVLGALLASLYTKMIVGALAGVWEDAVAGAALSFHAEISTYFSGALASVWIATITVWLVTRKQAQTAPRVLLSGATVGAVGALTIRRWQNLAAIVAVALAPVLALAGAKQEGEAASGMFFGAGVLLLGAGLHGCKLWIGRSGAGESLSTLGGLAIRNVGRQPGRSLAAITLLASGTFLVVAVGASRQDVSASAEKKTSGTGGFALYADSALPIYDDLNSDSGREHFGLDPAALNGAHVVALRLREGDEASCLNLNLAQTPRLLGVDPRLMEGRFSFAESQKASGWKQLETSDADGAIPVVGDTNTVQWSLHKKLGDTLPYVDDRGQTHTLRIVGVLGNGVLQGNLVMAEHFFTRLFPTRSGYSVFLIDAPSSQRDSISKELTRGLEDVGMSVVGAPARLAAFHAVENTYLAIFAALGGLGLLLGSAGLGVIVLRNVEERRSELALLRAVGYSSATVRTLLFLEHARLLILGLGVGVLAALLAVVPSLKANAEVPWLGLGLTLLGVFSSGLLFTYAAASFALRARLLTGLRNE